MLGVEKGVETNFPTVVITRQNMSSRHADANGLGGSAIRGRYCYVL